MDSCACAELVEVCAGMTASCKCANQGLHSSRFPAYQNDMPYKRPESVLVVIYTLTGEVLLLQRCDVPYFWQSVTGSLQEGEIPLEAAKREVWEETGLIAAENLHDCCYSNRFAIMPPWRARYAPDITHNIEHVFTLSLLERQPIRLNPLEHSHCQWLSWEQAIAMTTSYTNQEAIRTLARVGSADDRKRIV